MTDYLIYVWYKSIKYDHVLNQKIFSSLLVIVSRKSRKWTETVSKVTVRDSWPPATTVHIYLPCVPCMMVTYWNWHYRWMWKLFFVDGPNLFDARLGDGSKSLRRVVRDTKTTRDHWKWRWFEKMEEVLLAEILRTWEVRIRQGIRNKVYLLMTVVRRQWKNNVTLDSVCDHQERLALCYHLDKLVIYRVECSEG